MIIVFIGFNFYKFITSFTFNSYIIIHFKIISVVKLQSSPGVKSYGNNIVSSFDLSNKIIGGSHSKQPV